MSSLKTRGVRLERFMDNICTTPWSDDGAAERLTDVAMFLDFRFPHHLRVCEWV